MKDTKKVYESLDKLENLIKVLVVNPGKDPELTLIRDALKVHQEIVGGSLEQVTLPDNIVMLFNEEGKMIGLPFNRMLPKEYFDGDDIVCGTIILTEINDNGEFKSLSDGQVKKCMDLFAWEKNKKDVNEWIVKFLAEKESDIEQLKATYPDGKNGWNWEDYEI